MAMAQPARIRLSDFYRRQVHRSLDRLRSRREASTPTRGCWRVTLATSSPGIPPLSRATCQGVADLSSQIIFTTSRRATGGNRDIRPVQRDGAPVRKRYGQVRPGELHVGRQYESGGRGLRRLAHVRHSHAERPAKQADAVRIVRKGIDDQPVHIGPESLIGAKTQVIQGYRGSREINIAMQRGEVDAMCGISVSSAIAEWHQDLKNGDMKIIVQLGLEEPSVLRGRRQHLRSHQERRGSAGRGIHFPSERSRPSDRRPSCPAAGARRRLRDAFAKTMRDPEFLADAEKRRLLIDPMPGQEISQLFMTLQQQPKAVAERAKAIFDE